MAGAAVTTGAVHHSDAGSQYTSVRFTETGSTGTAGDAHDNALAETTVTLQIRPSRNGHPDGSPFRDGEPHVKPGSRGREPGLTWGARGPPGPRGADPVEVRSRVGGRGRQACSWRARSASHRAVIGGSGVPSGPVHRARRTGPGGSSRPGSPAARTPGPRSGCRRRSWPGRFRNAAEASIEAPRRVTEHRPAGTRSVTRPAAAAPGR
jgi:hypothetical protein